MSVKDQVREVVENLPENATYEDAMYAMYVRMKFEKGLKSAEGGEGMTTTEAKAKLAKWLS